MSKYLELGYTYWKLQFKTEKKAPNEHKIGKVNKEAISDLTLLDVFEYEEEYNETMKGLRLQKLIGEGSTFWIDTTRGNKGNIIALIKFLQMQGYYNLTHKITNEQIKSIAYNTFGREITIDYISRTNFNYVSFKYIPKAIRNI